MMMAHDSNPEPDCLSPRTRDALRSALAAYADAPDNGEQLRLALRAIAQEARTKSILAEQLLIALKETWHTLPNIAAVKEPNDETRLLQRVVTMCIKEYYE
jgi:hemoglobin-like flavoprotein